MVAPVRELSEVGDLDIAERGFGEFRFDLNGYALERRRVKDQKRWARQQPRVIDLPEGRTAQRTELGRKDDVLPAERGVGASEDDSRREERVRGEKAVPSRREIELAQLDRREAMHRIG